MFKLICVTVPLVFTAFLFTLWLLVERQESATSIDSDNITIWPTQPREYLSARILFRPRREGKLSRRERLHMAKFSITTTKPTRRTTAEGHINTRIHGKQAKRSTSRRRAYTMDINSEDYSIKKHGNWSANPAQYAYEARMSASAELKSILVKDIRKQFFQITAHRKNLSQLEILKNQSRVLYDNYMKIINKSTTINYWRRLRDARYNNTEPLDIDYSATLAEAYKDMFEYGGTTETGFITVPYSLVQYYRTCMDDLYNRIPPGPVIYDSKDILGSSGLT